MILFKYGNAEHQEVEEFDSARTAAQIAAKLANLLTSRQDWESKHFTLNEEVTFVKIEHSGYVFELQEN